MDAKLLNRLVIGTLGFVYGWKIYDADTVCSGLCYTVVLVTSLIGLGAWGATVDT